ncbi:MAG: DUF1858 domain-containing protein [Candidatus Obscuribacterales bacterium]|jgi:hypothetical protein|nr:DUF1858 domain-containing protein [Candidatus Obscuribacterales bacterium]
MNKIPCSIDSEHFVSDVLAWFPATQFVFNAYGLASLRNPVLRLIGKLVSIKDLCRMQKVDSEELLLDLNLCAGLVKMDECTGSCDACKNS